MLSYSFTRREKTLILVLAIILVAIAWYMLVFQRVTTEITQIDSEISSAQTEATLATAKVGEKNRMQAAIDGYKQQGVVAKPIPRFDNVTAVMTELNSVLSASDTYSLAFDEVKKNDANGFMMRGVRVNYSCGSREAAEDIISWLANGTFPCSIDSVSISDSSVGGTRTSGSGTSAVSATLHITYYERP